MGDNFSWSRFRRFARAEQSAERHDMTLKLGGFMAFSVAIYLICNMGVIFGSQGGYENAIGYVFPRFMVVTAMAVIVFLNISNGFKRYFVAGQASHMLMLPAAKSEKFCYVVLRNIVVIPLLLIGFILLNDLMWARILGIESWNQIDILDGMKTKYMQTSQQAASLMAIKAVEYLQVAGLFLLGSIFFRRRQFLLTLLTLFVWSILVMWSAIWIMSQGAFTELEIADMLEWYLNASNMYIPMAFTLFWTVLFTYLAWRRYARLQITK